MKISIVIPVYNEVEHLGACLAAIDAQSLRPHEVIVVDNNSSDGTVAVAEQFPFVTILSEKRQGVVHARTSGFNAASGDIIARIDADTLLTPEWAAQVSAIMADKQVAATSGAPHYYDFALPEVADRIDHYWRQRLADRLADNNFLYGANMAVRRSAWLAVRDRLCAQAGMHEDFDLALHLQAMGELVTYESGLLAGISSRRIDSGFLSYIRYTLISPRTYALHGLRSRRHMYPVMLICWLCYAPGRLLYRAYNPSTDRFSLRQLLVATSSRVDPATHVL